jgi:hypothetical protein
MPAAPFDAGACCAAAMAVNRKTAPKKAANQANQDANQEKETRRDTRHSPVISSNYRWNKWDSTAAANCLSRLRGGETTTAQRVLEGGSRLVKIRVHAAFRLATGNGFVKAIHLSRTRSLAAQRGGQRFCCGNPRAIVITYRHVRVSSIVLSGWPDFPDSSRKGIGFHAAFCIA